MLETFLTIRAISFEGIVLNALLVIFIAFLILFPLLRFVGAKKGALLKKRLFRLSSFCLALGLTGLALLFFNYEKATLLGSRIWFLVCGLGFLVWLGFILRDIFVHLPREKKTISEKEKFAKYLPK